MKACLLVFFFLSLGCFCRAQPIPSSPNKLKNNLREGRWTILLNAQEQETKDQEQATSYRIATLKAGKPEGLVRDYYRSGKLKMEGTFTSLNPDIREGKITTYFENGNKQFEMFAVNNRMNGEFVMHFESTGAVAGSGPAKNDSLSGEFTWFYESGVVKARGMMRNNQLNGEYVSNHPSGILAGEYHYQSGVPHGTGVQYNRKGEKMAEGTYAMGMQVRDWKFFGDDWETLASRAMYVTPENAALASTYYKQALDRIEAELGTANDYYIAYASQYGMLLVSNTEINEAQTIYTKLLNIYEKLSPIKNMNYVLAYNALGVCKEVEGKISEAEKLFQQSLDLLRHLGGELSALGLTLHTNLARLDYHRGQLDKAQASLEEIKATYENFGLTNDPSYSLMLENLANVYRDANAFRKAERLFEEIRQRYAQDPSRYAQYSMGLVITYLAEKKMARGLSLAQDLNSIFINIYGPGSGLEARMLFLQSLIEMKMGKITESKDHLEKSILLYEKLYGGHMYELGYFHLILGTLNAGYLNDVVSAYPHFRSMTRLLQSQLTNEFPHLSEKEKAGFYKRFSGTIDDYYTHIIPGSSKNPAWLGEVYDLRLATKGLLITSSNKWKQRILSSGDTRLIQQFTGWQQKKEKLLKYYKLPADQFTDLRATIDSLEEALSKSEKELSARSESFANLQDTKVVSWKAVQASLKKGEAAVEIIRLRIFGENEAYTDSSGAPYPKYKNFGTTDSVVYAALIVTTASKTNPELVIWHNGKELENHHLKYYRNAVKHSQGDKSSYQQFWVPLKEKLKGIQRIYLSPDGVFHQVNLNAMQNPRTNQYVLDEMEIHLVTNTRDLVVARQADQQNRYALLLGNPDFNSGADPLTPPDTTALERSMSFKALPGSGMEVDIIDKLLKQNGWNTELFKGYEATEEALKKSFKPRILHIATHGFFQPDARGNPSEDLTNALEQNRSAVVENDLLKSGLILAGAAINNLADENDLTVFETAEDGILTAYEAMNLNLDNTDLVVLSACETGLGEVKNGEGVYGLQRAFQVAGARTLIMSLWKVNDEATRQLMTEFYNQWLKTGNKFKAFRQAQLTIRKTFPEPYYWAPFILVGR